MTYRLLLFFLIVVTCFPGAICQQQKSWVIIYENFQHNLDTTLWHVEMDSLPGSKVFAGHSKLTLDTKGGVTVWLKQPLSGNCQIEYNRKILLTGGVNDRLSDMNQFWMANDIRNKNLFTRKGKFEEYDSLLMYYAGIGGNTNTTTRFRRYDGHGNRVLIAEKNDTPFLLKPNITYKIRIIVKYGSTELYINNKCFFSFRSTWSRQEISNFKVISIH
jgi:rhamnogalacturonan endolyase